MEEVQADLQTLTHHLHQCGWATAPCQVSVHHLVLKGREIPPKSQTSITINHPRHSDLYNVLGLRMFWGQHISHRSLILCLIHTISSNHTPNLSPPIGAKSNSGFWKLSKQTAQQALRLVPPWLHILIQSLTIPDYASWRLWSKQGST